VKDPYHHGFVLHTVTTVLRDLKLTDKQPLKPKLSTAFLDLTEARL
jgi:hypothetical protein